MPFLLREKKLLLYSSCILIIATLGGGILQHFFLSDIFDSAVIDPNKNNHWWIYFKNNAITCIIIMLGIFIYAITTIYLLIFNGFIIGVSIVSAMDRGVSIPDMIVALLPHGIFEIPALIIAGMIGLKGFTFYHQKKDKYYYYRLLQTVLFVLICLLFASFIEAYITVPLQMK